ncbi:SusC/RagA family TonB-linked outer membrane protein [Persicitalea jodogahamensis]|uniref:SusC/RagA family TonB-linked outer membrane protein n=1 Tax=Persicitalea jodogahamensis TaxID=402147 RepID=A0A8J3D829_9BACT|nr:TonB-dependent receptor [Persicitalea jodogahamensis]GHB74801.1 SusC/RagA family TonB-linked outer membrane protein [Persicitalea jodogahamensis]
MSSWLAAAPSKGANAGGSYASKLLATVSGKVTDENGGTLPGVSVLVKGTQRGTVTDAGGNFNLDVPNATAVLVFSFVGYLTKEVTVGNQTTLSVVLSIDAKALDEVVVVGYGTARKSDLTGSVGTVDVGAIVKAPVPSFADALAGRVAGVQVSSNDGQPGGGFNILIRGAGSLTQSTSPLFVVDGFPIEDLNPSTLNQEDIKSISILKDASSTAIYGSRAANGVVLIETKRGRVSKPVVSLSTSLGFQSTPQQIPLMSPYEFVKYQQELNPTLESTAAYFTDGKTLEDYRNVEGINWQDKVFRTGAVQIYNVSLRGGTDQTRYSLSGSLFDQKGVVINTGLKRYSGRLTLDQNIGERAQVGLTANYSGLSSFGQNLSSGAGSSSPSSYVMFRTWVYRPVAPDPSVSLENELVDADAVGNSDFRINPVIDLENQYQYNNTNVLDANAYLSYRLAEGLTFKTTAGIRHNNVQTERFYNSKTSQGSPFNPNNTDGINGSIGNNVQRSYSNENTLNYKVRVSDHSFDALALFAVNGIDYYSSGYTGRLLPNENLGIDGIDEGIVENPGSVSSRNTMASYAARLDYSFKSRYLATFTFRADGSSKFADPWGYFPGIALGWNMGQESFFTDALPFVSNAKIRGSYGSTGNNRIGDFENRPRLTQSLNGYSFNNQTPTGGVYITAVGNSALRWEKVISYDIGYELGLLENRVGLEIDLYRKITQDLLLRADLPPTSGFSSAVKNIGKLQNEGLELTLNTVNFAKKDFQWNSSFNISFNRNKILALTRGQERLTANGRYESQFNKPLYVSEVGKPAGMMYGFIWEGNYQFEDFDNPSDGKYVLKESVPTNGAVRNTIQPGDIKYRDINGDGVINNDDLAVIGRGQPIHTGGFANNFGYKGFNLNVFFQWSYGNDIFNANRLALEGNSNARANVNQYASYVNRWTPENPTNENYRTRGQGPIGFYSSKNVEDGSYLRLKTLSLDYSLPASIIQRLALNSLTLSVASQNLLTWTKYSGLDPEVSILNPVLSPGFDFSGYPQARTVTFGIKASF